jgi:hypothetical protein
MVLCQGGRQCLAREYALLSFEFQLTITTSLYGVLFIQHNDDRLASSSYVINYPLKVLLLGTHTKVLDAYRSSVDAMPSG